MSKKILAMLMAVAMAFSLLPVTALATGETSGTTTGDVVDGHYNDKGNWESGKPENAIPDSLKDTVTTVNKTAKKVDGQDNQYEVTLKVEMKHKETAVPPGAAATVLVIDTSGSMNYCTKEEHQHTDACYQWEECTPQVNPDHYRWDGGHKILNTNCEYKDGRYIYPASQTCGKEEHTHTSDTCEAPYRINAAKEAAKNFLNSYRGGTVREDGTWAPSTNPLKRYISVVWFNKGVSSREWLDVSTQAGYNTAIASINALSAKKEGTNLDAGLRMADAQLNNGTVKNIPANVVVLTDGEPTYYLKESSKKDTITIGDKKYQIKNDGKQCTQNTYDQTVLTAQSLRNSVSGVYTVCFGASSEILSQVKGKPTVGTFLQEKVATQPEAGSTQKYAYEAQDANELNRVFAAISSSVVSGLNTGKVTDALPTGVSCVTNGIFDQAGNLTWQLDPARATKRGPDSHGFITYTYEKTYKVQIDPTAEDLNVVNGYVPLNRPTILTVKDSTSNRDIDIPFPIPAGKVTYSLTGFDKALVTNQNKPTDFDIPNGVTIPETSTVTVGDNGVTLLYKITVSGDKGAKFTVTDAGARLVSPTDHSIVFNQTDSTFSGTVGTGETVFYVSKQFSKTDLQEKEDTTKYISNTATIAPGDNTNGLTNNEKTVTTTVTEEKPQTYTVTYRWAEGEKPSDATLPNAGNPYILHVGQKHTVVDVRSSVTTNAAGKTGTWSCAWNQNGTIEGTANQEIVITGTWTFEETVAPKGTLTVTKKVEGIALNELPDGLKIKVTNAGTTKAELAPTDQSVQKDETNGTLTWTIRDLPAGEYTVSETGERLENYTCEATYRAGTESDATVTVNGTASAAQNQLATDAQASQQVTVTAGETRSMTVTNTYTKNATVKLSDLIKKELTVKDSSTLPDNTTFSVTVTPKTVNGVNVDTTQPISGTVSALGTGNTNGDGDTTYTVPFDFKTKNTLSLPAGTYTYTVQENANSPISGMKYDSNTYTLTIAVENSEATVKYATGDATEATTTDVTEETPLTIKNTYQTPDLSVTKEPYKVNTTSFDADKTVAHVNDQIIWKVNVTNNKTTQASTQLTETLTGAAVYDNEACTGTQLDTNGTWTATVPANTTVTYYVTYTVQAKDIPNGKIVNTIVKDSDENNPINSDPVVSTWDTKQLKSATSNLNTSDWTTTVTLTLPTVSKTEANSTETEVLPDPITAISEGSYVIDKIGKQFTFMDGLSLEKNNVKIPMQKKGDTYYFGENATEQSYLYKLTYTAQNGEEAAQFKWEINENIPAGTEVTLSYKLKLTNPNKTADTYGVEDLNGDGKVDDTGAAFTENDKKNALYTNESATLYKDANTKLADFPKPSVSYTISSGSSGSHSGGSRPSLNTKDHYGYIIGYPVDYYTGQPTTDQTKKPVRPEGKITRAEVATIYFRMLTDESRTKFWSQSSGYSDVKTGDWFNNAVSTLSNAGIIAGYEDGSFRPNGYITRAEFATIAARFFDVTYNGKDLFPDISGHWAKDYINQAANKGFVNGYEDGTFKPDRNITRAEAVTLVNRTLDRHPDKNHFTKDMLVWPDNMDQTKWYYADMQEATNSHTYQMKENSDKTKYENWTKTLPIRNWEALEKAWSNANSSQGNGNVV